VNEAIKHKYPGFTKPLTVSKHFMGRSFTISILFVLTMPFTGISQTTTKRSNDSVNKKHLIDSLTLETLGRTKKEMEFSNTRILINSGQFLPSTTTTIDGCRFELAMDFEAHKADTVYWSTEDKKFETPEGFSVGMTLGEVKKSYASTMLNDPGWGYFINLPSKWNLGFCKVSSCTDKGPSDSTKVGWIFTRK
jgi:hypothetical protein